MKLVSFTVEKFRSIVKARKIHTDQVTVLVGPNNEGKSNILRALATAMQVMVRPVRTIASPRTKKMVFRVHPRVYDWERDFPVHLQATQPKGQSQIHLEFALTPEEVAEFKAEIGSNLNGTLPLVIALGNSRVAEVKVAKQGKGAASLNAKSARIGTFVSRRLAFQHIQAVRTAKSAQVIVDEMVEEELSVLETDSGYLKALAQVERLQRPILDVLSKSIKETLLKFLPAIKDVRLEVNSQQRFEALRRSAKIIVDDGTPTQLQYKGDGVQSLAALGIMRHSSELQGSKKSAVMAVEEPESHLHPAAIHELRDVLRDLSQNRQIVLTTHCPLFVDRTKIGNNILVMGKRARPAKSIHEVREALGVRASDNLRHAELVLLVEGEDDRITMAALLATGSKQLRQALENGTLAIDTLGGGTNLSYKASLVLNSLCQVHCFLDDDSCGRSSFKKAQEDGLLNYSEANFATCAGLNEAEIEDLLAQDAYEKVVWNVYKVSLKSPKFHTKKKWSERMRETFKNQGKLWDDTVEQSVKLRVARAVAAKPAHGLNSARRGAVDGLVAALKARLTDRDYVDS